MPSLTRSGRRGDPTPGVWVLPETFVRHGHCAPQCFPSYKFSNLGNR
nr:MAG TPA: hypothetical protein [Caudoviricetes sp.]